MDQEDILMKLLNDNPDPPVFCFHKALFDSAHQCTPPDGTNEQHQHTAAVATSELNTMSTPLQLKKVFSPRNLELDSDTSSVVAGWSFSMATPTCPWVDTGKTSIVHNSTTTTDEEASISTDGGGCGLLPGESPPLLAARDTSDEDRDKSCLKIRNKMTFTKDKPVVRTLFPPKTTPLKHFNTPLAQNRPTLDPSNFFSPIPPPMAVSPLVKSSHHAGECAAVHVHATPMKHQLNCSIATSSSLFETPAKVTSLCGEDGGASSQDMLFGSPEIFTPMADVTSEKSMEVNVEIDEPCDVEDVCKSAHIHRDASDSHNPSKRQKCATYTSRNEDQHLLVPSPDLKSLTCPTVHLQPIIHSTPLYCHNTHPSHPPPKEHQTPDVPIQHAHEPTPPAASELVIPLDECCVPATLPNAEATAKVDESGRMETQLSYKFESSENLLDLLFMSPTQLDEYLNKKQSSTATVGAPKSTIESVPKSTEDEKTPLPFSQLSIKHKAVEAVDISTCLDNKQHEPTPDFTESAGPKQFPSIHPPNKNETSETPHCGGDLDKKQVETKSEVSKSTNSSTSITLQEGQPPTKRVKRKMTNFLYPGSKKLSTNKKRRSRRIMKRKDSQSPPPQADNAKGPPEQPKREHSPRGHNSDEDGDGEPPQKKPHIDCELPALPTDTVMQCDDSISKVDESVMEHLSQKDPQGAGSEVPMVDKVKDTKQDLPNLKTEIDTLRSTEPQAVIQSVENLGSKVKHADTDGEDNCTKETVSMDVEQPVLSHFDENFSTPESAVRSTVRKPRAPGLSRRTARKSNLLLESAKELSDIPNVPSTCAMEPKETTCEHIKPISSLGDATTNDNPSGTSLFGGFCTAAGSKISVSHQAMEKAKLLLKDEELDNASVCLPEKQNVTAFTTPSHATAPATNDKFNSPSLPSILATLKTSADPTKTVATPLSVFKTPLNAQSKSSHSVSSAPLLNKVISRMKRPASTFKAPRKANSVSKEEEKASIARILRGFRASGAGSSGLPPKTDNIERKVCVSPKKQITVSGFSTAAGSKLTVSSESMEKAKQLLMNDKENGIVDSLQVCSDSKPIAAKGHKELTGFTTASGKGLSVSTSAIARAKQLVDGVDQVAEQGETAADDHGVKVSVGFQTAAGKSLSVSTKALSKAELIMSSVSEEGSDAHVHVGEQEEQQDKMHKKCATLLTGFQSAGGKDISVSSKSLERAQKIVDEEDKHEVAPLLVSGDLNTGRIVTGFSTAGGSSISVSKTSLQKAQNETEIEMNETLNAVYPPKHRSEMFTEKGVQEDGSTDEEEEQQSDHHCSLTVADVDALNCFTQVSFHRNNPPDRDQSWIEPQSETQAENVQPSPIPQTHTPLDSSTLNVEAGNDVALDHEDSHSHYFSTQVVRQLLEFSSDEEMSCTDDKDVTIPTKEKDGDVGSCKEDVASVQSVEEHQSVDEVNNDSIVALSQIPNSQPPPTSELSHMLEEEPTCAEPVSVMPDREHILESNSPLPVSPPNNSTNVINTEDSTNVVNAEEDESMFNDGQDMLTESMVESVNLSAIAGSCCKDFGGLQEPADRVHITRQDNQITKAITSGFEGLQTASGNKVSISEESLEAARRVIDSDTSGFPGLQTASGNKVNISGASLEAARSVLGGIAESSGFPGLQTASGNEVSISNESLQAAKTLLDGDMDSSQTGGFPGLQTASGNKVNISKDSLHAARSVLNTDTGGSLSSGLPGLQTASGAHVSVSKESLEAARTALGDDMSTLQSSGFPGLQTASGNKVSISKESLEVARGVLNSDTGTSPSVGFRCLQSASGAQVHVSKESLDAARAVLCDTSTIQSFPGLQTASGNKVDISKESLKAVKTLLDGDGHKPQTSGFPGLQTASGNKVSISRESLNAARGVLNSDTDGTVSSSFPGLQTASGNKVNISKESLDAARSVLNSDLSAIQSGGLPGLQTASGTQVESRAQSSGFPGLQTASGSKVRISKESLEAARATLGDSVDNDTAQSSSFLRASLQTAGGSKVSISKQSLQAARTVLGTAEITKDSDDTNQVNLHDQMKRVPLPQPSGMDYDTSGEIGKHSDSSKRLEDKQDGKYRPMFKPSSAKKGTFQVPSVVSRESVRPQPSRGESSGEPMERYMQHPMRSTRGVVSTPEATFCDRAHLPKRRPLLPQQSHHGTDNNLKRNTGQGYSHSLPSANTSSNQTSHVFKTPHRHSSFSNNSARINQQEMNTGFSSPRLDSNYPGNLSVNSTVKTPMTTPQSQTCSSYPNRGFSYPRNATSTGRQKDRYSTCTPVWKASLGKRNASGSGHKNHRRSIVFTPVQKKPDDDHSSMNFTNTVNQSHSTNSLSVSSRKSQVPNVSFSEHPTKDALPMEVPNTRTSTQLNSTSSNCELTIPLSPLHITLSQLHAMEELDLETQGSGGGDNTTKDTLKATNDSGYVSREVSATKSPSPGVVDHENCKLPSETKPADPDPTCTIPIAASDDNDTDIHEREEIIFAEVAKEILDDSLEVDDCELPEEILNCILLPVDHVEVHRERDTHHTNTVTNTSKIAVREVHSRQEYRSTTVTGGGAIRPQSGSLFATRVQHKSSRIPLQSAVRGRPPGRYTDSELHSFGVHHQVVSVTASNAVKFCFFGAHFFSSAVLSGLPVCVGDGAMLTLSNRVAGVDQFWDAFRTSPSVDQKFIGLKWFENHYKQLVWKLASMERSYPELFAGRCLTPDWLMMQMKYRYDREIDHAERPAIRKICEQDDVPSRRMVLCVSDVHTQNLHSRVATDESARNPGRETLNESNLPRGDNSVRDQSSVSSTNTANPPCIVLTDGWYSLPGIVDPPLKYMLKTAKISIGTKLLVCGAELLGLSEACHPLEAPASCCLKISANSTRRARWFAKLGYQPRPHPFPVALETVFPEGGVVGCTHAVIARVYPMVYLEKNDGAKNVMRNEKLEFRIAAQYETKRQKKIEGICSRVQREFEEEVAKQDSKSVSRGRRSRRLNTLQVKQLQDGEEIYNALTNASDPQAFQELLGRTQLTLLESYRQCLMSQRQDELQQRIKQAVQEAEDQLPPARNVIPLLKIRLVPLHGGGGRDQRCTLDCHLSIWRPSGAVKETLREGRAFRMCNVTANPSRYKGNTRRLQLTATRSTRYDPLNDTVTTHHPTSNNFYLPRIHTPISHLSTSELAYGEFDTVGVVVCVTSGHVTSHDFDGPDRPVDTVYLAHNEGCLLEVKVWDGLKSHGLEDTIQVGRSLALSNLSYKGLGRTHHFPTATASDITTVSQQPRQGHLRDALRELKTNLPGGKDQSAFLQTLEDEVLSYL